MKQFSLEEYLRNPQKKIITKDGRNVRIICTDRKGLNVKPIAALITLPDGDEVIKTYWRNGVETRGYEGCPNDLFFATEKKTGWINVIRVASDQTEAITFTGMVYPTKAEAIEDYHGRGLLDTIKIEWEE